MGRPSKFSPEFREQPVVRVGPTGKTIAEVPRDLRINDAPPDIPALCWLLQVSGSGFSARPSSPPARALANEVLTV